jgi:hypothetical protein
MRKDVRWPGLRADAIAISPTNRAFIIELKAKDGKEHFASLAEVSRLRRVIARYPKMAAAALPAAAVAGFLPTIASPVVLVTAAAVSAAVASMARQLEIELLSIDQAQPARSARIIVERLVQIEAATGKDDDIRLEE